MSLKLKFQENQNDIKTEMSTKQKKYQNQYVRKLKVHQNLNFTKTEVSPKLKSH